MSSQQCEILDGLVDRFNGIMINTEKLAVNIDEFPKQLQSTVNVFCI